MVQQKAKKYGLKFKARIQYDRYEEVMDRRLAGEKLQINLAMDQQFQDPESKEEKAIFDKVLEWHQRRIPECEKILFEQKKRLADSERKLQVKETKKALEDKRIATKKIGFAMKNIQKHKSIKVYEESDSRIFPFHFMSMLYVNEKSETAVAPFRYLLRPANKDESFDRKYTGCYNARLDSLDEVPWWKSALGKRHGLIMVERFYESVAAEDYAKHFKIPKDRIGEKNLELCFAPDNVEYMFIPTLWDKWMGKDGKELFSAALITDEPAPEVKQAGHDRTPIFLRETAVESWLRASETTTKDLAYVLNMRERPHYSHAITGVA